MKKGAKIGIGIGVVVALGVASYFLFFRKKDKPKNSNSDSDDTKQTSYKGKIKAITPFDDDSSYVGFSPYSTTELNKGDIAIISDTNKKLDGEYPVLDIFKDSKSGKPFSVKLAINKNYKPVFIDKADRTFDGFGSIRIMKTESKSDIGGCGCGA
jgi:hypothetical protein